MNNLFKPGSDQYHCVDETPEYMSCDSIIVIEKDILKLNSRKKIKGASLL